MKYFILFLFFSLAVFGDVKISDLPLSNGSTTGSEDSFPYVSKVTNTTKRLTVWDIANVPALTSKYATLTDIASKVGEMGAVDSAPNANGATISGSILTLQPANGTYPGVLTAGTQTIGGDKTFAGNLILSPTVNSSLSGANARIPSHTTANLVFTNASLTSIGSANNSGVSGGHLLTITNATGAAITIVNNYASASAGEKIITGAGSDVVVPDKSSFAIQYNATSSTWSFIGSGYADVTNATGILPIAHGGTNNSSTYTAGSVVYSDGTKLTQDNSNFFWDNTNKRLGIGNAAPSGKLNITSAVNDGIKITDGTTTSFFYSSADATNSLALGTLSNHPMSIWTNNTKRMTILSTGEVGINNASPGAKLDVRSEIRVTSSGGATGQLLADSTDFSVGPTGAHNLRLQTNGTTRFRIDSSGNVGIGSSAPGSLVHIASNTANSAIRLQVAATGEGAEITFNSSKGTIGSETASETNKVLGDISFSGHASSASRSGALIRAQQNGSYTSNTVPTDLYFYTGDGTNAIANRMTISAAGNVGIGVTPTSKLTLNGSFARNIVTQTGDYTVATTDTHIICNKAGTLTLTLPTASSFTGREITVRTITANTVVSASSNVVPAAGGAAGTAILSGTAGKWALLVSDGTNWQIQMSN